MQFAASHIYPRALNCHRIATGKVGEATPLRLGSRVLVLAAIVGALGGLASCDQTGFGFEEDVGLLGLFRLRGARPPPDEAVVVRYDRDTLSRLRSLPADPKTWPEPMAGCAARHDDLERLGDAVAMDRLPRSVQTCLIDELHRRGAAVIAFDIAFRHDPSRQAATPALAAAIHSHGGVVLLEQAIRVWLPASAGRAATGGQLQADLLEGPDAALAAAAAATAPFLLPRGSEQVHQFWAVNPALPTPTQLPTRALEVLSLPALVRLAEVTDEPLPRGSAPAELLKHQTGWFRAQTAAGDGGINSAEIASLGTVAARRLAALQRIYQGPNSYYLNFYGPPGSIPSISVADLLIPDPTSAPMLRSLPDLRGRVVFVGYQELGITEAEDSFPTAFRSSNGVDLAGVEIAATAFGNLLHGEALRALPEGARIGLVVLIGIGLTVGSCIGTVWRGLAATAALAAAYGTAVVTAFLVWNFWLPWVIPLLGLVPVAVVLSQVMRYLGAARWLGVYAPRQVSRKLLRGGDLGSGAAQRREVTIMLTDIVGFTTLAERNLPEMVTAFVNRHFTMLTRCVEAEGGTVAQFIGDSMMSFWGAPDPQPDHAARACRTALAIAAAIETENAGRHLQGQPPIQLRIGINTGPVTAGNVGAPGRSNYGIVGDTVNTTQRIEQLAKIVCTDRPAVAVLVSERTRALSGPGFRFADAGAHAVKGREEWVQIFRLDVTSAQTAPAPSDPMRHLVPGHG